MDSTTIVYLPPAVEELWYRVDHTVLYPPFLHLMVQAQMQLLQYGYKFYVTQAWRSFEYQAQLYAYGRTDMSRGIITNAKPGQSVHHYWCATDSVYDQDPDRKGLQPDWTKHHYKHLADAAQAVGLEAGFYWRNLVDGPHIQLPLRKHRLSSRRLRRAYRRGERRGGRGKEYVFRLLDRYNWTS